MKRVSCPRTEEILASLATGDPPEGLRDHLVKCPTCAAESRPILWLRSAARSAGEPLPTASSLLFRARARRLWEERSGQASELRRSLARAQVAVTAGALVLAVPALALPVRSLVAAVERGDLPFGAAIAGVGLAFAALALAATWMAVGALRRG